MSPWDDDQPESEGKLWLEFGLIGAIMAASVVIALFALFSAVPAYAHGGGLAADGCHKDNKNGGRHCHRGPDAGKPTLTPSGEVYYPNCTAARNAGAAPVRRGQPGYGRHLDRDGDGIGCE